MPIFFGRLDAADFSQMEHPFKGSILRKPRRHARCEDQPSLRHQQRVREWHPLLAAPQDAFHHPPGPFARPHFQAETPGLALIPRERFQFVVAPAGAQETTTGADSPRHQHSRERMCHQVIGRNSLAQAHRAPAVVLKPARQGREDLAILRRGQQPNVFALQR